MKITWVEDWKIERLENINAPLTQATSSMSSYTQNFTRGLARPEQSVTLGVLTPRQRPLPLLGPYSWCCMMPRSVYALTSRVVGFVCQENGPMDGPKRRAKLVGAWVWWS